MNQGWLTRPDQENGVERKYVPALGSSAGLQRYASASPAGLEYCGAGAGAGVGTLMHRKCHWSLLGPPSSAHCIWLQCTGDYSWYCKNCPAEPSHSSWFTELWEISGHFKSLSSVMVGYARGDNQNHRMCIYFLCFSNFQWNLCNSCLL